MRGTGEGWHFDLGDIFMGEGATFNLYLLPTFMTTTKKSYYWSPHLLTAGYPSPQIYPFREHLVHILSPLRTSDVSHVGCRISHEKCFLFAEISLICRRRNQIRIILVRFTLLQIYILHKNIFNTLKTCCNDHISIFVCKIPSSLSEYAAFFVRLHPTHGIDVRYVVFSSVYKMNLQFCERLVISVQFVISA